MRFACGPPSCSIMLQIAQSCYLAEFAEAILATLMHPTFSKAVLILAAILAATPCLHACTGPPALEAKLRADPDADTYAETRRPGSATHQTVQLCPRRLSERV